MGPLERESTVSRDGCIHCIQWLAQFVTGDENIEPRTFLFKITFFMALNTDMTCELQVSKIGYIHVP